MSGKPWTDERRIAYNGTISKRQRTIRKEWEHKPLHVSGFETITRSGRLTQLRSQGGNARDVVCALREQLRKESSEFVGAVVIGLSSKYVLLYEVGRGSFGTALRIGWWRNMGSAQLQAEEAASREHQCEGPPERRLHICQRCGKEYQPRGSGQKYCVECRDIIRREHAAARRIAKPEIYGPDILVKSGIWLKKNGRYQARTWNRQTRIYSCFGTYDTLEEAMRAKLEGRHLTSCTGLVNVKVSA